MGAIVATSMVTFLGGVGYALLADVSNTRAHRAWQRECHVRAPKHLPGGKHPRRGVLLAIASVLAFLVTVVTAAGVH